MKECILCGEEAICEDLKPKRDAFKRGTVYDYKTPLEMYDRYWVCNKCFHLEDKTFFNILLKKEKERKNEMDRIISNV